MINSNRRNILKGTAALTAGLFIPNISFASLPTNKRFIVMILRGGMDGIMAVPPYRDEHYLKNRKEFVTLPMPGEDMGIIDLNGFFGLHPSLAPLKKYYDKKQMAIFPAIASPYRGRSHFDAQKQLELGTQVIDNTKDGWLNRTLQIYYDKEEKAKLGMAVGQQLPLILQGNIKVGSWFPSNSNIENNLEYFEKVAKLYEGNKLLEEPLQEALRVQRMAIRTAHSMDMSSGMMHEEEVDNSAISYLIRPTLPPESMQIFGKMMSSKDGPRIAVMESGGWDTHARQGTEVGSLANRLTSLAVTLDTLIESLGDVWNDTIITVVTEFGRQVEENGTKGTDHGTGSASFVLGGRVNGGQFYGKWPGLAHENLFEDRDLKPTIDMRSMFKTVLSQHLDLDMKEINKKIFPESKEIDIIGNLINMER